MAGSSARSFDKFEFHIQKVCIFSFKTGGKDKSLVPFVLAHVVIMGRRYLEIMAVSSTKEIHFPVGIFINEGNDTFYVLVPAEVWKMQQMGSFHIYWKESMP
mgnify:FL=1